MTSDDIEIDLLLLPLVKAETAVARWDERLRRSPVRDGILAREDFRDACSSLWLDGELVHLADLVLHDAHMDVRSPSHELVRAHDYLRARRLVASSAAGWALTPTGLAQLRGHGPAPLQPLIDSDAADLERLPDDSDDGSDQNLNFAEFDQVLERSNRLADQSDKITPSRAFVYSEDWDEHQRLSDWLEVLQRNQHLPALLAAAYLLDAWDEIEPLERRPWMGRLLVPAMLRSHTTTHHLAGLSSGLKTIPRHQRRSLTKSQRLIATLAAFAASASQAMNEHERLMIERQRLMRKTLGRRSTSHLADLIEFVLSKPIVNADMIARHLKITPKAAHALVAELDLHEMTGRSRYRAWGV